MKTYKVIQNGSRECASFFTKDECLEALEEQAKSIAEIDDAECKEWIDSVEELGKLIADCKEQGADDLVAQYEAIKEDFVPGLWRTDLSMEPRLLYAKGDDTLSYDADTFAIVEADSYKLECLGDGKWTVTDIDNEVECEFVAGDFVNTAEFTPFNEDIYSLQPQALRAKICQDLAEWLRSTRPDLYDSDFVRGERKRIGQMLQQLRLKKGLSLERLASACGIDKANISKIENGRYNVSIDILSKIAAVLGSKIELI